MIQIKLTPSEMVFVMGLLDRKILKTYTGNYKQSFTSDLKHIHAKFRDAEIEYYRDRAHLQKVRDSLQVA
jgi:hypothetical protein